MNTFNQFTNLYNVQKTLRFELQPVGKTRENIEKNGLLKQDEERAENYKKVKGFIDEYHKQFIKDRLWNFKLPMKDEGKRNSLEEYQQFYELSKRDASQEAIFTEIKDNLRAIINKRLTEKGSAYERIFKKELMRQVYENFEKMLIDKLNCYIDKQADSASEGGMLHALQLTNKFESLRWAGQTKWLPLLHPRLEYKQDRSCYRFCQLHQPEVRKHTGSKRLNRQV